MNRRKRGYLVETQKAPITIREMEVKEVVEINRDVDTVTLQIVFTNKARIKKTVRHYSLEYDYRWKNLKEGDKVNAVIQAQKIIEVY